MLSEPMSAIASQRFLGVPVEVHPLLGSTNDEAFRRALEGAPEGLVVVAEAQSAGRGRHGRSWLDSPGQSLLFSILLAPSIPLPSYPLLALALAGAIAEAGREVVRREAVGGEPMSVKWPNDVIHRGRKLCGVLAESRSLAPGKAPLLMIGAGVNGNQLANDFPPEIRERATSLRIAAGGRHVDLAAFFESALARYAEALALARGRDSGALFERVRPWLPEPGASVRVVLGERVVEGSVEGVTQTGALRIRDRVSGEVESVAAGVLE